MTSSRDNTYIRRFRTLNTYLVPLSFYKVYRWSTKIRYVHRYDVETSIQPRIFWRYCVKLLPKLITNGTLEYISNIPLLIGILRHAYDTTG